MTAIPPIMRLSGIPAPATSIHISALACHIMSFVYTPPSVPLARPSAVMLVYRYDGNGNYIYIPNIVVLQITWQEGADPGSAHFRYVFGDPILDSQYDDLPQRFEQVYPLDATSPYAVLNDDRLVVTRLRADGSEELMFDGFAQIPQADLDSETETVSFVALGTPIREWDTPLDGALMRDADTPVEPDNDIQTLLPARFNPDGMPNAQPAPDLMDDADTNQQVVEEDDDDEGEEDDDSDIGEGNGVSDYDSGDSPQQFPVFLGPIYPANTITNATDTYTIRYWFLGMAARYIMCQGNPDEEYVQLGDLTDIDADLTAITPISDSAPVNLDDSSTYSLEPITVQDYDVTGEPWPVALQRLIEPHGFAFRFILDEDDSGDPLWRIALYRKDDNLTVQSVMLQPAGENLDPGQTNVGSLHLARDGHDIVNDFYVITAPTHVEASFVLSPYYLINTSDATGTGLQRYIYGNPNWLPSLVDFYRTYIFDECGEGHWDFGFGSTQYNVGDFKKVLTFGATQRPFVHRRRPGRRKLVSVDSNGKPLKATLHVSSDYKGDAPGVWDGKTGTWEEVDSSEWELLPDRLGIRITCSNPNEWKIGVKPAGSKTAYTKAGVISLIEWTATPATGAELSTTQPNLNGWPIIRLTCVVDDDLGLNVEAPQRIASPTNFRIVRLIDARDRFQKRVVSRYSAFAETANIGPGGTDVVLEDDTADAQSQADGLRRAHELGQFAGSVTIPRVSTAYSIGDKIDSIDGRDVSLQMNAGSGANESPIYPTVVGITYEFDGKQSTVLTLSDHRTEPAPKRMESHEDQ